MVKCTSCSELTHLKCTIHSTPPTPFYCCKCPNPRDQVQNPENQVEFGEEVNLDDVNVVNIEDLEIVVNPLPLHNSTEENQMENQDQVHMGNVEEVNLEAVTVVNPLPIHNSAEMGYM